MSSAALQARKGKKHTAEYKADRPLCGTWAEIDGEAPLSIASIGLPSLYCMYVASSKSTLKHCAM